MITLDRWRGLDQAAAERCAASVAAAVGARLLRVARPDAEFRPLLVARFDLDGREFVLIPGGTARLGYDAARFEPTRDELASFNFDESARLGDDEPPEPDPWHTPVPVVPGQLELFAEPPVTRSWQPAASDLARLRAHLAERLTPPRVVTVPALLMAADPVAAGHADVPADHPLVVESLRTKPWQRGVRGHHPRYCAADDRGTYAGVRFDSSTGRVERAWTTSYVTYDEITASLAAAGRRLPTPDEWEYAQGLGGGTLFPWGDRMLRPGPETVSGLRYGSSYDLELTTERAEIRGGDLGETSCGGWPAFYHVLLRAPAFRDPELVAAEAGVAGVRDRTCRDVIEIPAG